MQDGRRDLALALDRKPDDLSYLDRPARRFLSGHQYKIRRRAPLDFGGAPEAGANCDQQHGYEQGVAESKLG